MKKTMLDVKYVGATSSRPLFEGITKRNQKGITLIALIITIIAMLILVGVTVNVALNGGVFSKAKQAATEMEKQAIHEQIVASIKLENSGKIDVAETYNAANTILTAQGKKVTTKTNTDTQIVLEVEGKNGTYTYTITEHKIVMGETNSSDSGLKVSHQIIDGTKVALKVENGIDTDKTLIEYIEANFGSITLDESGWIAIAKKLGGINITTKDEALEHINVNYFRLPQTQSEEDTKESLVMAAADIKVNGAPYNMLASGYLIDIGGNDTSTIEVAFGELSTTVEIGEEENEEESVGFVFDTWYVKDNKYIKFSENGNKKIKYTYRLGNGGEENIEEEECTDWIWNSKDGTSKTTYEMYGMNVIETYKWTNNAIEYLVEVDGEINTNEVYTLAGSDYPFEFCWSIGYISLNYASDYIINFDELVRYVKINEDVSIEFEVLQGKRLKVNWVKLDGELMSTDEYTFENNVLEIPNVSGKISIQLGSTDI